MMKNPKNLLIFAVLGGVVGFSIGFVAGRVSVPQPEKLSVSEKGATMSVAFKAQKAALNAGDVDGFIQGYELIERAQ